MPDDDDAPRYTKRDALWKPPGETRASRTINFKSRASGRAIVLSGTNREIHCESLLERKIALQLLTNKLVQNVVEQPPPVDYIDATGKSCKHFFDFLVTMTDGRRIAIAVRPEARAGKIRALLPFVAASAPDFADGFLVLTQEHAPQAAVANASLILSARRTVRPHHEQTVRTLVAGIHGDVTIGDIVAASGLHGDGFRAVVRLIDKGELRVVTGGCIDYATRIEPNSGNGEIA